MAAGQIASITIHDAGMFPGTVKMVFTSKTVDGVTINLDWQTAKELGGELLKSAYAARAAEEKAGVDREFPDAP